MKRRDESALTTGFVAILIAFAMSIAAEFYLRRLPADPAVPPAVVSLAHAQTRTQIVVVGVGLAILGHLPAPRKRKRLAKAEQPMTA